MLQRVCPLLQMFETKVKNVLENAKNFFERRVEPVLS
jgi:hypothetical protein